MSLCVDLVQCSLGPPHTLHSSSLCDRTRLRKSAEVYQRTLIQLPKNETMGYAETRQLLPLTSRPDNNNQKRFPQMKEVREEATPSTQDRKGKLECGKPVIVPLGSSASS